MESTVYSLLHPSLNLAVGDSIKNSSIVRDALDTTLEITKLIKKSLNSVMSNYTYLIEQAAKNSSDSEMKACIRGVDVHMKTFDFKQMPWT